MRIRESVEKIQDSKELVGHYFYETFFLRYPAAREYFRDVDMWHQGVLLTVQLGMVEQYYSRNSLGAEKYLQILGTRHQDKGIPRELYGPFREVLLEVLAEFLGDDWDATLDREWNEAMDGAIAKMMEGYETRFSM